MNISQKFKKEVLFEALKMTIATISILIEEGCKDNARLAVYTNYYCSIALKSFYTFNNEDKNYSKKDIAIKKYHQIYMDNFAKATQDSSDLNLYFKFNDEYMNLSSDEKLIIVSFLTLSSFYSTKSINKVKNILRTYIFKLKNCIKNSGKYYSSFDISKYDLFQVKCILFNFLIENS